MVYRRLYFQVLIRVALLLATCILLSRILFLPEYLHTSIVISGLLIAEIIVLINYLNRTNRKLERFYASLADQGSSISFRDPEPGRSYRELGQRLEKISTIIQTERREKEIQRNYLNYLIEHIGVGILTYRGNGEIVLANPAAKKIFACKNIPRLAFLNKFNPAFEKTILDLELNRNLLLRIIVRDEIFHLTVRKSLFRFQEHSNWLISFQEINSELDRKEMESWQKMIRVLTHEIMSSISPVSSLAGHLLDKIQDPGNPGKVKIPAMNGMEDIAEGLDIIKTRGEGLLDFVKYYHSLTHLPIPEFKEVRLESFLGKFRNLIEQECDNAGISVDLKVKDDLKVSIDPNLIEQVLLNLIRNSIQALEGTGTEKTIWISAGGDGVSGVRISVKDNGCGIDMGNMDNIFIPFYTTREKGSGIGLSFARQIMRLHEGQISVRSVPGKGSEFILKF